MGKLLWNKKGFTLGEVVTVTAIIGTLTAIALPNFLRVKMNVNMEMVKQHLRVIGQEMGELMNQDPLHQFPANLNFDDPMSAGEFTITASLNGIDSKGYTSDGYSTQTNRSTYMLRTCPKEGLFGIAGDRCFLLDPSGIREIDPWDADGVAMTMWNVGGAPLGMVNVYVNRILAEPVLSPSQRAILLADILETSGYYVLSRQLAYGTGDVLSKQMPSIGFVFLDSLSIPAETNRSTYETLLPQAYSILKDRGISMVSRATTDGEVNLVSSDEARHNDQYQFVPVSLPAGSAQVGFQFQNEITLGQAGIDMQKGIQKFLQHCKDFGVQI